MLLVRQTALSPLASAQWIVVALDRRDTLTSPGRHSQHPPPPARRHSSFNLNLSKTAYPFDLLSNVTPERSPWLTRSGGLRHISAETASQDVVPQTNYPARVLPAEVICLIIEANFRSRHLTAKCLVSHGYLEAAGPVFYGEIEFQDACSVFLLRCVSMAVFDQRKRSGISHGFQIPREEVNDSVYVHAWLSRRTLRVIQLSSRTIWTIGGRCLAWIIMSPSQIESDQHTPSTQQGLPGTN